jgi:hypothetical protein
VGARIGPPDAALPARPGAPAFLAQAVLVTAGRGRSRRSVAKVSSFESDDSEAQARREGLTDSMEGRRETSEEEPCAF